VVDSDEAERWRLIRECAGSSDVVTARALNRIYQESHAGDPVKAAAAAASLELLARCVDQPEIAALAAWTSGMAAVHLQGHMEHGVTLLEQAAERFIRLDRPLDVAATQVSRLQGLAMLGRYDEAITCGLAARDAFERHGDLLAAGKIEQNLGNIAYRRGRFPEAERLYRSARERYVVADSQAHLAQIENNLGTVLSEEHRFSDAGAVFEQALGRAERSGLEVTQTEVRYNLGCLAMFRGQYDRALDHLEHARRTYAELHMPHRSARAELELADAYLELNLAPEAAATTSRLARTFADLGMRAEEARAIGCHGRAAARLGDFQQARTLLAEATELYSAEGNVVDAAFLTLVEAQLLYSEGDFAAAADAAARSESRFVAASMWGRLLLARWLRGEAGRAAGGPEARTLLESTLREARTRELPQIAYRCLTSLGLLAASAGDETAAQRAFEASVSEIETLRAPLPAEEFRAAFLSDKLTPFSELVRLSLSSDTADRAVRAFGYVERARSRALVDMLAGVVNVHSRPRDAFEAGLVKQLEQLREELQWFYSQINRIDGAAPRSPEAIEQLHAAVREREAGVLEIRRRIEQRGGAVPDRAAPLDISALQRRLGAETALVEYFSIDGKLMAFVITDRHVEVIDQLGTESELETTIGHFRSQIHTLRLAGPSLQRHSSQLIERTRHHLQHLYDRLLRPLEPYFGDRGLVVVPHRALHYVPFHALHDGTHYVIERRVVSYAPSAAVLFHCLERPRQPIVRPVFVGVADVEAPRVRDEVASIAALFPGSTVRLDSDATVAEVRKLAAEADLLHLACHGRFRPDSPLFSAVRLADGWLTVGDAYELELHCELVTLSACETGVSAVAPGEELIGLARGFFSAGTPSLMVSLWTVDDNSTAELMSAVYQGVQAGLGPAEALAAAQRQLIQRYPHPYYWSAFFVLGRG
jgi:CHAT domain-containing protein/tetratricopeptide (TPR) repeat protein